MYLVCICTYHYFKPITSTGTLHVNICWYILACIVIHTNLFPQYWACTVVCIKSVFAHIIIPYRHNTNLNTIHTNTDGYIFNTFLLVLNMHWHVFNTNTCHKTCHNTCQFIGYVFGCIEVQYTQMLTCSNQ